MEFNDLTEEQKQQVLDCKTPEEIVKLAQETGYELSDDELDGIAGGSWGDPCNDHCANLYK